MKHTADKLVSKLKEKGLHIAFAESCTGGLAAATIIGTDGASSVLDASVVTYANHAKVTYCDVSNETIEAFGVVSEPVVREMAQGIARNTGADIGVGISGIAGPGGGTPDKPVGTVCFGVSVNGKTYAVTKHFGDLGRNTVREKSVSFVLEWIYELVSP